MWKWSRGFPVRVTQRRRKECAAKKSAEPKAMRRTADLPRQVAVAADEEEKLRRAAAAVELPLLLLHPFASAGANLSAGDP